MHPLRRRGFSLVELIITLAIVSIVMAGVSLALVANQTAFWAQERRRDATSQARTAVAFIEADLALAGYGLEAPLGLDFNVSGRNGKRCTTTGAVPPSPGAPPAWPAPLASDDLCFRDATNRPDELVIHYRDPSYWGQDVSAAPVGHAWPIVAASVDVGTNALKLTLRPGDVLAVGRVLQLVCSGGQNSSYVTVKSRAENPASATAPADVLVALEPAEPGNPFRHTAPTNGCFSSGSARAFVVLTRHYYVEQVGRVPYLFLDEGYDRDGDGAVTVADRSVVAEAIEDLQVAYDVPRGATETRVGLMPGAPLAACGVTARPIPPIGNSCAGKDMRWVDFSADAQSQWKWSYLPFSLQGAERRSPDAANVVRVTFGVVARSLVSAKDGRTLAPPVLFNRDPATLPTPDAFERVLLMGSARPANLASRGLPFL